MMSLILLETVTMVLVGCASDGTITDKDGSGRQTPLTLAEAQDVVVTRHYRDATVEVTAHPIQVKDGVAALSLDYKLVEPMKAGNWHFISLGGKQSTTVWADKKGPYTLRLLDLEQQKVYQVLPSQEGKGLNKEIASAFTWQETDIENHRPYPEGTLDEKRLTAGSVSLFAAPETTTVAVLVEPFGMISEVPVVAGGDDFDNLTAQAGSPMLDNKDAFIQPMRQFDVAYDGGKVTQEIDRTMTIAITSDVLFATDEATLSDKATATLDQAVTEIKAATPNGTVQVVGHTDNVYTDDYNQTLSEKRAGTVKAYLSERLSNVYQITAEGRGKKEPIAEGTSDEARTANRRVEIIVQRTQTITKTTSDKAILPEAPPAVGSGLDWVEYKPGSSNSLCRVRVNKVVRTNGALVGYLEVGTAADSTSLGSPLALTNWHSSRLDTAIRGYHHSTQLIFCGVQNVSLLMDDARRYPYDYLWQSYENGDSVTDVVGDTNVGDGDPCPLQSLLVTVVWPDTGTDTVTIEVPTLFRITTVPVTAGDPTATLNAAYPLRD